MTGLLFEGKTQAKPEIISKIMSTVLLVLVLGYR